MFRYQNLIENYIKEMITFKVNDLHDQSVHRKGHSGGVYQVKTITYYKCDSCLMAFFCT